MSAQLRYASYLLIAASAGCSAPGSDETQVGSLKGYNLVVVLIDTLRADHLGTYGYDRPTSPFFDNLAEKGLVFENTVSSSSYTLQSVSTLMSGRLPTRTGATGLWASPSAKEPVLAEYLKNEGYVTCFVTNSPIMAGHFSRPFDSIHGTQLGVLFAKRLSERAVSLVDQAVRSEAGPYFLYIHYSGPHAPYDSPREYFNKVFGRRAEPRVQLIPRYDNYNEMMTRGLGPGHPEFEELVRAYDADIAYTEDSVKLLIDGLREKGLMENTLVIVTSDHGEEFLEHGYIEHSWTLYNEVLHVPLILWADGDIGPARITNPVSQADLLPTLLEIPYEPSDFDGVTWYARENDRFVFKPTPKPRIAELIFPEKTIQRAVMDGPWKLYTSTMWVPPEGRFLADRKVQANHHLILKGEYLLPPLWEPLEFQALFNLDADPRERNDLSDQEPERVAMLKAYIEDYRAIVETRGLGPKWIGSKIEAISDDNMDTLRSLGYIQ